MDTCSSVSAPRGTLSFSTSSRRSGPVIRHPLRQVQLNKGGIMGQYECHVFVCTSGETCPTQGDTEKYVKALRAGVQKAGKQVEVRINKTGCFSQCGNGPMIVVYPDDVWYAGVQESDLDEILTSHILGGRPVERLRYAPGVPGANKIDVEKKDLPSRGVDAGPAGP